jgi:transcription initiation factor IIE alpha subunit
MKPTRKEASQMKFVCSKCGGVMLAYSKTKLIISADCRCKGWSNWREVKDEAQEEPQA